VEQRVPYPTSTGWERRRGRRRHEKRRRFEEGELGGEEVGEERILGNGSWTDPLKGIHY